MDEEWSDDDDDDDSVMTSMPPGEKTPSPAERLNAKGRRGFSARDLCKIVSLVLWLYYESTKSSSCPKVLANSLIIFLIH